MRSRKIITLAIGLLMAFAVSGSLYSEGSKVVQLDVNTFKS